jgi:hypothetical protein
VNPPHHFTDLTLNRGALLARLAADPQGPGPQFERCVFDDEDLSGLGWRVI